MSQQSWQPANLSPNAEDNKALHRHIFVFFVISRTMTSQGRSENSDQSRPLGFTLCYLGRDPFNQNSNRSDREKRTTSKGGPVFSKLFRLDRTDPLSFGPKFPEILVEWIAPLMPTFRILSITTKKILGTRFLSYITRFYDQ